MLSARSRCPPASARTRSRPASAPRTASRSRPSCPKTRTAAYTAKISSLTNSTYVIIYNEASFADTAGKWYNDIVTEMASRTIVNGKTAAVTFDGDGFITRAEYAAILVRALGIPGGRRRAASPTSASGPTGTAARSAQPSNTASSRGTPTARSVRTRTSPARRPWPCCSARRRSRSTPARPAR
jgi:hypothetical protein